jgi:RNA polymerase sigma-70 factor (ECF subfamily)
MQSDANLVKQFLNGDEQAFHRLIIKYQADIYALTLSYVRNPEDAKELTQEVFFEAYKGISSLKQPESFCFWLRRIARNQYHIWRRKEKGDVIPLVDMISDAMPTDELMILRESFAKVMQVIEQLPETEKDILKSRYLEDASYEELQKRYDLSYKALNMRLSRAKQKVLARVGKLLAGIGIFSWHDALEKILLGGVEAVKISAKVKIITIGIGAVLVLGGTGVIIWNSHSQRTFQEAPTPEITKQSVQKTLTSPSVNLASSKKFVSSKPIIAESAKIREVSTLPEPQEKENPAKATNTVENKKENKEKTISAEEAEYNRKQFEEARKMYEIQAREQFPIMVERFKAIKARREQVGTIEGNNRYLRTEAEKEEDLRIGLEMDNIQRQLGDLANKYHSTHQEEGAIFYPDGWIGRYLKEVGMVVQEKYPK